MGAQQGSMQQPQIAARIEFRGSMDLGPSSALDVDYVREVVEKLRERGEGNAYLVIQERGVELRLDF